MEGATPGDNDASADNYAVIFCCEYGAAIKRVLDADSVPDPRTKERELTRQLPEPEDNDDYAYYILRPAVEVLRKLRDDPAYADSHKDHTNGELHRVALESHP